MDQTKRLGAILRALKITEIVYSLSGGGDSGETDLESVTWRDGHETHDLPDIPVFITDSGRIRHLPELLQDIVFDAPEGDWVNNEGGYGNVYVRPYEEKEGLVLECEMTFREDGDYGEDGGFDEEEFEDDALDDGEEADAAGIEIIGEVAP